LYFFINAIFAPLKEHLIKADETGVEISLIKRRQKHVDAHDAFRYVNGLFLIFENTPRMFQTSSRVACW
jgi:hypothetical protein